MDSTTELIIQSQLSKVQVRKAKGLTIFKTPFTDCDGESIEVNIEVENNQILLSDLGRVAGLLFSLNKHNEKSKAFKLIKKLTDNVGKNIILGRGLELINVDTNLFVCTINP